MRKRSAYFESQRQGSWRWTSLLRSLPLSAVAGVCGGGVFLAAMYVAGRLGLDAIGDAHRTLLDGGELLGRDPVDIASQLALTGALFWPAAIAATWVHGRSIASLLTPLHGFRWSILGKVLALQVIILVLGALVTLPLLEGVRFNKPDSTFFIWLIPIALVTLFQTSAEDVFFKGYLLRQVGAAVSLWWFAPLIVTIAFVSLHIGNPDLRSEIAIVLPYFVISELFIIYLLMRTGGMEAALATHWLNNFFLFVVLAEAATQSNDLTLFVFDDDASTSVDEAWIVGGALVGMGIQYLGFTARRSPFYLDRHGWTPTILPPSPPPNVAPNGSPATSSVVPPSSLPAGLSPADEDPL